CTSVVSLLGLFFFQAEDGIRDRNVTGVQTCALPIFPCRPGRRTSRPRCPAARRWPWWSSWRGPPGHRRNRPRTGTRCPRASCRRSEERRVGKECRSRGREAEERKHEREGVVLCRTYV